ncbi:ead/Ea22-like family protein [Enterobacter asburiae]|uniref:ead/Ea22-like family protein n=1 Tax=Enterobacter asburiae TaxID=61645 RepID=UPI003F562E68
MDTITLQQLKTAAKNATQGNWCFARLGGGNFVVKVITDAAYKSMTFVSLCKLPRAKWRSELQTAHDAIFISSASPERVIALIESLEESKARIAEQEDFIREQDQLIADLKRNLQTLLQRTVTVRLPEAFYPDGDIECPLVVELEDVREMLSAAGIKVEVE